MEEILEGKVPREQAGRDTFGRYRLQAKSAAIAALKILKGDDIDMMYCDLHDDFVLRKKDNNGLCYIFYQVKTNAKQNHNWTTAELLGIPKKGVQKIPLKELSDRIRNSFVGKLLLHTIVFDKYCNLVVFQTNINVDDDVETFMSDVEQGNLANHFYKILRTRFNEAFEDHLSDKLSDSEISNRITKLRMERDVEYLKEKNDWEPYAKDAIYKYSEIDLNQDEIKSILQALAELVQKKSSGKISDFTCESIRNMAGITIDDLLQVLSISTVAYHEILRGGDQNAVKSASIIQRLIANAGGGKEQLEYCSKCKTEWDLWLRKNRHNVPEFDLNIIMQEVFSRIPSKMESGSKIKLSEFKERIVDTLNTLELLKLRKDLNENLIFGAMLSEIVRKM